MNNTTKSRSVLLRFCFSRVISQDLLCTDDCAETACHFKCKCHRENIVIKKVCVGRWLECVDGSKKHTVGLSPRTFVFVSRVKPSQRWHILTYVHKLFEPKSQSNCRPNQVFLVPKHKQTCYNDNKSHLWWRRSPSKGHMISSLPAGPKLMKCTIFNPVKFPISQNV